MTFAKAIYVLLHIILAVVCLVVGICTLAGIRFNLTLAGGALMCSAATTLFFHASAALHGRKR